MADEKKVSGHPEIKDYLILRNQGVFIDSRSGVRLNLFNLSNSFCKTPQAFKEKPEAFPILLTALHIGHLVTADTPPTAGAKRVKLTDSPLVELLKLEYDAFKARVLAIRSIDYLDQVVAVEEGRTLEHGGPRRNFLGLLLGRRADLLEKMEEKNTEAYSDNQDPLKSATVAKQPLVKQDVRLPKKPSVKRKR